MPKIHCSSLFIPGESEFQNTLLGDKEDGKTDHSNR